MQNNYPDYTSYPATQDYQSNPGYPLNPSNPLSPSFQPGPNYPLSPSFQPGPNYPLSPIFQGGKDNNGFPDYSDYQGIQANCPTNNETLPYDYSPVGVAGRYCNEVLTRVIQECEATCEFLSTHLKSKCDCRLRKNQLTLLIDCADSCGTTAKFVARGSDYDRQNTLVCARICECCGQECARFNDRLSQQCAEVCFYCARACYAFARGY